MSASSHGGAGYVAMIRLSVLMFPQDDPTAGTRRNLTGTGASRIICIDRIPCDNPCTQKLVVLIIGFKPLVDLSSWLLFGRDLDRHYPEATKILGTFNVYRVFSNSDCKLQNPYHIVSATETCEIPSIILTCHRYAIIRCRIDSSRYSAILGLSRCAGKRCSVRPSWIWSR